MVSPNGSVVGELGLADLRTEASQLGIRGAGNKKRQDLILAIAQQQKEQEDAERIAELRVKCTQKGLATTGSIEDLELRLAGHNEGAVQRSDRWTYTATVFTTIILGIAALCITAPHIAAELTELMGCSIVVGYLFAIVIDGGFCSLKVVDTLGYKFELPRVVRWSVWSLMMICLALSAALNASQFLRHVEPVFAMQALAVGLAVFISAFVFLMFMVGSTMIVKCEDKSEDKVSAAEAFRQSALMFDALEKAARKMPS